MSKKIDYSAGIYDAPGQLGWPKTILLGFQHVFAMFGATVLVPIITGLSISVTLFFAGVGTLLFHALTKRKVPAFLGSSFAFLGGFELIAQSPDGTPIPEMLPYACGGIVVAGLLYVALAGFIKLFGVKKVMRLFPPVVTGPIIILIGLILAPVAVSSASQNWILAGITIAVIVVCTIFGKGMAKIIPILLGIITSYIVAAIAGWVDFTKLSTAGAVDIPPFMMAKFNLSSILTMTPIAIATIMEHIGGISAISATCGKNFIAKPGLHRTLIGDGLATSLAGLFGGPANTTYGENTGVLALSRVYDPKVIRIAAVAAIALAFSPWFDALVGAIPAAIVGGASFVLYGMISAIGVRNMLEHKVDLTNSRNLIISAIILVSGLGIDSIGGVTVAGVTFSGLASAAILGITLNAILPGKDYEFDMGALEGQDEK